MCYCCIVRVYATSSVPDFESLFFFIFLSFLTILSVSFSFLPLSLSSLLLALPPTSLFYLFFQPLSYLSLCFLPLSLSYFSVLLSLSGLPLCVALSVSYLSLCPISLCCSLSLCPTSLCVSLPLSLFLSPSLPPCSEEVLPGV